MAIRKIIAISVVAIALPQAYRFGKTLYNDCSSLYQEFRNWKANRHEMAAKTKEFTEEWDHLVSLYAHNLPSVVLESELRSFNQKWVYYRPYFVANGLDPTVSH